jgi:hypothetical protein
MSFRDERRYTETEAYYRVVPKEFSPEELERQKAAFLAKGGKIDVKGAGQTLPLTNHSLRAQCEREAAAALGQRKVKQVDHKWRELDKVNAE